MSTSTSSACGSTATVAADVWMRPCVSVSGTRCTRCTPDSNFSRAKTPRPAISAMISLKPPSGPFARREDFDAPALQLGVALIHAEEIAGKERRLVAAGSGAHFENGALLVGGILGQKRESQARARASASRSRASSSSSSARARISASSAGSASIASRPCDLAVASRDRSRIAADDVVERRRARATGRRRSPRRRLGEPRRDFVVAAQDEIELVLWQHGLGRER